MGRVQDRVALITGASSGIGLASVAALAGEGAHIAGLDINEPDAGAWRAATAAAGKTSFRTLDVRDAEAVASAVEAAASEHGRIDVLVNCAGVVGGGPVHIVSEEEWDRVVDVNLKGTFLVCKSVVPHMLEQRRGSIINIASVEGLEGAEGGSAYNASKGGVIILTKNMAIDFGRRGIRVNAVCPGFIETPLALSVFGEDMQEIRRKCEETHQLGRWGRPEEVAASVLFLASDEASFISGQALAVDGGFTAGHTFGVRSLLGLD